ncbi:MAG: carboxypeptidase regulatory-like domain-containing protein [Kiritimatiellae bacterium]|nr:carboxypeptidase regulatory-like domain-containing protein [Kiritimatiellia bacterium]
MNKRRTNPWALRARLLLCMTCAAGVAEEGISGKPAGQTAGPRLSVAVVIETAGGILQAVRPDKYPRVGVSIRSLEEGSEYGVFVPLDDQGLAHESLRGAGPWSVKVEPTVHAPFEGELLVRLEQPGQPIKRQLRVEPVRVAHIRGRLVMTGGAPLSFVKFRVDAARNESARHSTLKTDRQGHFLLEVLDWPGCDYTLYVSSVRISGNRARHRLERREIDAETLEWVVPAATPCLEVAVAFREGAKTVPYTEEIARQLHGTAMRALVGYRVEHGRRVQRVSAFLFREKATFFDLEPGNYELAELCLDWPGPERVREFPVLPREHPLQIATPGAPLLRLAVVVGEAAEYAFEAVVQDARTAVPIPGVRLDLMRLTAGGAEANEYRGETDERGVVRLRLRHSTYRLRARKEAYDERIQSVPVEAGTNVVITLARRLERIGKVLGPDGEPVPDVQVWWRKGDWIGSADSRADGSFVIPPLAAGSEYELSAGSIEPGSKLWARQGNWGLNDNEPLVIRLKNGLHLSGRIEGPPLEGKKRIRMAVLRHGDHWEQEKQARIRPGYRFDLWVAPGRYTPVVVLDDAFYLMDTIDVKGPVDGLLLKLQDDRKISREELEKRLRTLSLQSAG